MRGVCGFGVFPDVPVSKKPIEVRMGSGKGSVEWWAVRVRPGRILFELDGIDEDIAREAFRLASSKLPVRTTFVRRFGRLSTMAKPISELRGKGASELKARLSELRRESLNLRFQQASGQLENTARRRQVRRDIARVRTLLTQEATKSVSSKKN